MDELLRRQSSVVTDNTSCMWGLLQFFKFHQRLHKKKMTAYKRHGDNKRAGRTKISKSKLNASSISEEDEEANFLMEDKVNATNRGYVKSRMKTLISKLYKKQDQKQKISPSTSRLLRTISIHYLECNDYVLPDDLTSDSETSTVELGSSSETDSSASSKHVPLLPGGPNVDHNQLDELENYLLEKQAVLMEKFYKVKESLLEQKNADARDLRRDFAVESKEFLDMLELFDADGESFLRILEDSNSTLSRQDSSPEMGLTKSGSFPGAGLSGRRNDGLSKHERKIRDSFVKQEVKSPSANAPSGLNTMEDDSRSGASIAGVEGDSQKTKCSDSEMLPASPCKSRIHSDRETVLNRFNVLKERIKEVITENKTEQHRISMDGFLHKIPYGYKVPEDMEKEKLRLWDGPASERYEKDGPRWKHGSDGSVSANGKYKSSSIQRSRSLTESVDRYSRLLESTSLGESKRAPERLKSIREQDRKFPKTLGRMFSNPEFGSFDFSKGVLTELSTAPLPSKTPTSGLLVGDAAYGSDEPKSLSTIVHSEDNLELDTYAEDTATELEQKVLINEHDQNESYMVSDDSAEEGSSYVHLNEQEARIAVDSRDKTTRPSPISVLDSNFQEGLVSPAKYSVSEGSELNPRWITFEELDSEANNNTSNVVETIGTDFDYKRPIDLTDFSALNLQVSQKDEAAFNYVRDVLNKSCINGEDLLESWSVDDPLQFVKADGSHHELDIARNESTVDHQLLFDLINEVLLDLYKIYISPSPGLSRFGPSIRPKPVGNRVLEEVWSNIAWYLSSEPHLNPTLDYYVARDFARNDGWMNLQYDAQCVGIDLEGLIMDDLLDEALLNLVH